jgi:hypothetical protein
MGSSIREYVKIGAAALACLALASCGETAPEPKPEPEPVGNPEPKPAEPDEDTGKVEVQPGDLPARSFATLGEAMNHILEEAKPRVIGFGEVHQLEGTVKFESSVERFSRWVVPELAGKTSDLVVETWVNLGVCGAQEAAVHKDLDETTERPETTESEVVRLLKRAEQLGVRPHILEFECKDYEALLEKDSEVDYFEMLGLITRELEQRSAKLVAEPTAEGEPVRAVAVYGGAIHNDLAPHEELAQFSFAAALDEASGGRYVEVDLLVPEFLETSEPFKAQPWYSQFARLASPDRVTVIERAERSYVVALRKGVVAEPPPTKNPENPSPPQQK